MTPSDPVWPALEELRNAVAAVEGVGDVRAYATTHYSTTRLLPAPVVEMLLTPEDARLVALQLEWARNDAVDRVEVAAVVESIRELVELIDSPRRSGLRALLAQLPGGVG